MARLWRLSEIEPETPRILDVLFWLALFSLGFVAGILA